MCAVSAVSDYYIQKVFPYQTIPVSAINSAPKDWNEETKDLMRKLIEFLDKVDQCPGDKECMDDSKKEFFKQINYKPSGA